MRPLMTSSTTVSDSSFLEHRRALVPDRVVDWLGDDAVDQALLEEAEVLTPMMSDLDRARPRCHRYPLAGAIEADYLPQMLEIGGFGHALVGLGFKSHRSDLPFFDFLTGSIDVTSFDVLRALLHAVQDRFAHMPHAPVRIQLGDNAATHALETALELAGLTVDVDRIVMSAPLIDVMNRKPLSGMERIEVQRPSDLGFFAKYRRAYDEFHALSPTLQDDVAPESEADLADWLDSGEVREIMVDGKWAGLVAAIPTSQHGCPGYQMVEEILDPAFHGQRLAAPMQRCFLASLPKLDHRLVWGLIHPSNHPSLRTAERVGRVRIGQTLLLRLRDAA